MFRSELKSGSRRECSVIGGNQLSVTYYLSKSLGEKEIIEKGEFSTRVICREKTKHKNWYYIKTIHFVFYLFEVKGRILPTIQ